MKFALRVPLDYLDSYLKNQKIWWDPHGGPDWSQVKAMEIVVKLPHESKTFTFNLNYRRGENNEPVDPWISDCCPANPSCLTVALRDCGITVKDTYYIALSDTLRKDVKTFSKNILDHRHFDTHGYIPVCSTLEVACEAFDYHCKQDSVTAAGRKIFKIRVPKESKIYVRRDKWDRWKAKLFSPIPLGGRKDLAELLDRWDWYQDTTPYTRRWKLEWDQAKISMVEVE